MSYPPLSGYASYYDTSTPSQSENNPYGSSRQSGSASYSQQVSSDDRQSQYPPPAGYDWPPQGQEGYSSSQQSYDAWREANGHTNQYDYRRDASTYATQGAASNTQNYYGGSSSTLVTSSMAGLNNLAYASGLDTQRSVSRTQQSSPKYPNAPVSTVPNRMQSPAQTQQQQEYGQHQPQRQPYPAKNVTTNTAHEMTLTAASRNLEVASQNLAISAAQALAGAVTRKNQSVGPSQLSPSPAMNSTNATHGSKSSYSTQPTSQSHLRTPSTQGQRNNANSSSDALTSPNAPKARPTGQAATVREQASSQSKRSSASQSNSISNLVTSTTEVPSPPSATEAMPTYIDPTQVFNPYHREHERRRKEAAETEARKKAEDVAAAKKAKEAQVQKSKTSAQFNGASAAPAASSTTTEIPGTEDDMALEMKMMMEKMKAFRQKDPSMFQKLWEDMRGKPNPGTASASNVQSPSPQISQRQSVPPATAQLVTVPDPTPVGSVQTPPARVPGQQAPKLRGPKPTPHAASAFPHAPANGWRVIVEDNEEELPDIGRFPAERRIRGSGGPRNPVSGAHQMPAASAGAFPQPGLGNSGSANAPPGQVPGPLPPKTVSGGVEWPRDKRDALAKAAVDSLKAVPENQGIEITTDDIHAMLEQNPSYIQLCDLLEKKGLRFHRGHFARQLLTNVPDLATPQKVKDTPSASKGAEIPATAPPKIVGPPSVPLVAPNGYQNPSGGVFIHQSSQPPPVNQYTPPTYGPPPSSPFHTMNTLTPVKAEFPKAVNKAKRTPMPPARPEPPPGSKEAMARKRDFSELIDLTELDDNDDYVLSSKHPRLDSPSPEPDPFEKYRLEANMQPPRLSSNVPFSSGSVGLPQGTPLKFDTVQRYPPTQAPTPTPPPPQPKKTILARAVNKGEALRKSYYDPKTVARDILIAAGRHPQERPLNAHMASLLGKHIELDSDLDTFDWDAIDPGGPTVRKVEYVDIPAVPPRFHLGQRTDRDVRIARDQANDKLKGEAEKERLPESDKRDSEDAATSSSRAPPGPQSSKERFEKKYYSGRGRPPRGAIKGPRPSRLRETQGVDEPISVEREVTPKHKAILDSANPSPQEQPTLSSTRKAQDSMESETPSGSVYPSGKRRGRPPGSKNKHLSVAAMKKFAAPRPQIEIDVPTPSSSSKPFKCRWIKCHAELHNLDTLRRHVARVHRPSDEEIETSGFVCWWRHCKLLEMDDEGNFAPSQLFTTSEEWMEHINEDHLHKVAMKYGDGPNTSQIDSQSIAQDKLRYLADSEGRATTPSVAKKGNTELPSDAMTFTNPWGMNEAEEAAQKAFLKVHRPGEKIGQKNTAEEILRSMEMRKAKIGPGIDRGGCTLVNEARRATLAQNPGVRRVVDADY